MAALGEVAASEVAPGVAALLVVDLVAVLVARTLPLVVAVMTSLPWKRPSLGFLGKITRSSPLCRTPRSSATARQMVDTTQIQRQNVKFFTSVLKMETEALPSTHSCVQMGLCLVKNISFVTGGSILTVQKLKLCIH